MQLMRQFASPTFAVAVVFAAAAAVGACKRRDQYAGGEAALKPDGTATITDTNAATAVAPMAPLMPSTDAWTSPTILGFALVANDGEIAMGKLGESKATTPAVKAFAMVQQHLTKAQDIKATRTT